MSFEKQVATFAAWLETRAAEQQRRRRFTHSRTPLQWFILKAEAEEIEATRAAFERLVVEPLPPIERALFLSRVDIQQQRAADRVATP